MTLLFLAVSIYFGVVCVIVRIEKKYSRNEHEHFAIYDLVFDLRRGSDGPRNRRRLFAGAAAAIDQFQAAAQEND